VKSYAVALSARLVPCVRWSVLAALSNKEIVLLLAEPALLRGLSVLSVSWEQPPALCFDAAVDALAVDLGALKSRAKQVEALLTEPEGVSVLDAAIDAVIAGAPEDWALTHTKASRADC
jgi:hypothetical protein